MDHLLQGHPSRWSAWTYHNLNGKGRVRVKLLAFLFSFHSRIGYICNNIGLLWSSHSLKRLSLGLNKTSASCGEQCSLLRCWFYLPDKIHFGKKEQSKNTIHETLPERTASARRICQCQLRPRDGAIVGYKEAGRIGLLKLRRHFCLTCRSSFVVTHIA